MLEVITKILTNPKSVICQRLGIVAQILMKWRLKMSISRKEIMEGQLKVAETNIFHFAHPLPMGSNNPEID